MTFSKSFPRTLKGSNYPRWDEVFLTDDEEKLEEVKCRQENLKLMDECINDAKIIIAKQNLKPFQSDLIRIAIALFDKRASHAVYWKENKAKEKFDKFNQ
jgi:hypothetical protein